MLERFKSFIEEKKLFTSKENILLAVSGGLDSMAMTQLFIDAGYTIAIAHLNHKLRGKESDEDAEFVQRFAQKNKILFFKKEVDIKSIIEKEKRNLQDLAREIRYQWFDELCQDNDLHYIATAHHLDDEIEGFLFNFSRTGGLKSLSGIQVKRNNIIRPLLFTGRKELYAFVQGNKIAYREDSSNLIDKYRRNFIRHHIVPKFDELNPSFRSNASSSIAHLKNTQKLYQFLIKKYSNSFIEQDEQRIAIKIEELKTTPQATLFLYELISKYGFNYEQSVDMVSSEQSGSLFFSKTHKALLDRDEIIIQSIHEIKSVNQKITADSEILGYGTITLRDISYPQQFESNSNIVHLDKKLLQFPLTIRNWLPGDSFHPLGMEGSQKVKDFLINNKVDRFEKEKTLVLCSGEQICWLIGWRIDDHFKLTDSTERVMKVEWKAV